jgi:opacity protein-like surface antigen
MKKHYSKLLAAVALCWLGGSAYAGDGCAPCEQPATRGGWYGSAGVLVLKQVGGSNPAFVTETYSDIDPVLGQTTLLSSAISEFSQEYNWSGRIELGVKDASGFGLRFRFFWIEDSSSLSFQDNTGVQSDPAFPGQTFNTVTGNRYLTANPLGINFGSVGTATAPSTLRFSRDLDLRSYDFDITSDCKRGNLELTLSAGLRYLTIDQSYNASEAINDPLALEATAVFPITQNLNSSHDLRAFGPTVGLEARYALSCNLKGFLAGKFGILYAEGDQSASLLLGSNDPNFQLPNGFISSGRCLALPVGEVEVGAEYSTVLGCDGPELFVRGSVLSMAYWGAGNAARVNSSNQPANEDLIFFGFSAQIGIRY